MEIYYNKYLKYKLKYFNLKKQLQTGGKTTNLNKIINSLKSVFKEYKISRAKYVLTNDIALFFHEIKTDFTNIDLITKEVSNNININQDTTKKYFYDINI